MQDFTVLENKHIRRISDKSVGPIKGQRGANEEESRNGVGREDPVRQAVNTKLQFILRILVVKDHLNEQIREVDALDFEVVGLIGGVPGGPISMVGQRSLCGVPNRAERRVGSARYRRWQSL